MNLYFFQPQQSIEFRAETNYYLPYSVGCLWSYASQFDDIVQNYTLKDIVFKREPIASYVQHMQEPTVCGFSCYIWNQQYCLAMARAIRAQWPNCVIVFGGPNANSEHTKYHFVDCIIMGEGESVFVDILRTVAQGRRPELFYPKQRITELNIPSLYLTGVFDTIIAQNPDVIWAMTLETNRGCPFACSFCDWGSVTYSKIHQFSMSRIASELAWAETQRIGFLFVADANFGVFRQRDIEIARLIRHAVDHGTIESVNLQYAKNSTDAVFEIARIMGPASRGITVSVQSMNPETLELIHRQNLAVNDIQRMMQLSEQHGVSTYTELILGLPGETAETWRQGITDLLELGQHQSIDLWFAELLPNAELASSHSRAQHGLITVAAGNYMTLNTDRTQEDPVPEYMEIIVGTNTMSPAELIQSYLYAEMIVQWHISGLSAQFARYARTVKNISYREFYDAVFVARDLDPVLGPVYSEFQRTVTEYLQTGVMPPEASGHGLHSWTAAELYNNRESVWRTVVSAMSTLTQCPEDLPELQRRSVFDPDQPRPGELTTTYNIYTGEAGATVYSFKPQITAVDITDFYRTRRKGLLKNTVLTRPGADTLPPQREAQARFF